MERSDAPVTITKDVIKINFLGYQLKLGKLDKSYETFEDFIEDMMSEDEE